MVPIPETVARRRYRELVGQDSSSSPLLRPKVQQAAPITYGRKRTGLLSLTASQFRPDVYDIPSEDAAPVRSAAVTGTAHSKEVIAKRVKTPKRKPVYPRNELEGHEIMKVTRITPSKGTGKTTKNSKPCKANKVTPVRRIPVNELVLVHSPLHLAYDADPEESSNGVETRDPIRDPTSSPLKRRSSASGIDYNEIRRRIPLSVLRARFKIPKNRRKLLGRRRVNGDSAVADFDPRGRDGFEDAELSTKPHLTKRKRSRTKQAPLVGQFGALHLETGLLPPVEFEPLTTELKLEPQSDHTNAERLINAGLAEQRGYDEGLQFAPTTPPRRVSVADRLREDRIRAQLSSISAPERAPSESDKSDAEVEEEGESENEDSDEQDGMNDSDLLGEDDSLMIRSCSMQTVEPGIAHETCHVRSPQQIERAKPRNLGVTLDFRPASVPGQLPRQPLGKRSLVEVNDAIIEVPDSNCQQQSEMRRRSILKNSTPVIPESTTRPEATESNTRRNSIVEASESRYFAHASEMLDMPDPSRQQVVPRRRSRYFRQNDDVQVPFTERVVPETSPEPPSYTGLAKLDVVPGGVDVQPTSGCPAVSKDLKSLTRSVSKEHGTLSQSARRRLSLSFHPPVRVT